MPSGRLSPSLDASPPTVAYEKDSKSLFFISLRMQDEHKFPPKGRSGRFFVFGSFARSESLPVGTPERGFPHAEHFAFEFLLFS